MRLFISCILAMALSAKADITADSICSSLAAIESSTKTGTNVLNAVNDNPDASDVQSQAEASIAYVDNVTKLYNDFNNLLIANPAVPETNQTAIDEVTACATANTDVITAFGDALVIILPIYKELDLYRRGCDDGIDIAIALVASYTNLATRYPSDGLQLALESVIGFVDVPIDEPVAVACFSPVEIPGVP